MNYDWKAHDTSGFDPIRGLRARYPSSVAGFERLPRGGESVTGLQETLHSLKAAPRVFDKPRLFISHRQSDSQRATEVSRLATSAGFEFWLDVIDPGLSSPSPQSALYVGIAIEIALLNCSHVIALLTSKTAGSLWVPYEYGRVKTNTVFSSQAGCWTDLATSSLPEYVHLGPIARSDSEITTWLRDERRRAP